MSEPEPRIMCVDVAEEWMCTLRIEDLRVALSDKGLHIVTAADKAVVDAVAVLPEKLLRSWVDASQITRGLPQLAVAELAKREAKP